MFCAAAAVLSDFWETTWLRQYAIQSREFSYVLIIIQSDLIMLATSMPVKAAFHDTDTDTLADSPDTPTPLRKILARMSVSMSVSWNADLSALQRSTASPSRLFSNATAVRGQRKFRSFSPKADTLVARCLRASFHWRQWCGCYGNDALRAQPAATGSGRDASSFRQK